MIAIGLMSGTSADGIDAAVVEIVEAPANADGAAHAEPALRYSRGTLRLVKHVLSPHPRELREEILACCDRTTGTVDRVCALSAALGEAFADAAILAAREAGVALEHVGVIGSHGQTVWHIPERATLQIGQPAVIAERTGVTTVSNFRSRDISAGGHGAPLVAFMDALLFTHPSKTRALQNIGGIGNVTFLPAANDEPAPRRSISPSPAHPIPPIAFDTGPGNMLIDYAAGRATNGEWTFDRDGALARGGRVDGELIEELMEHDFLKLKPPKTTGREVFGAFYGQRVWDTAEARGLRPNDIVATLTAFTAMSITQAYREFLPSLPDEIILSGGGALNPVLAEMIARELPNSVVTTSDALGLPAEAKEAVCFAVLAHETLRGRPGNLPSATGARRAVVLGDITPGANSWHNQP